jgi:hypothetical protein
MEEKRIRTIEQIEENKDEIRTLLRANYVGAAIATLQNREFRNTNKKIKSKKKRRAASKAARRSRAKNKS